MLYPITPRAVRYEPYAWMDKVFSDEELRGLQERARRADSSARVGGANGVDPNVRRSTVDWVANTPENGWLFAKLSGVAADLNAQFYGFDLFGFGEALQLTNYSHEDHGMYGWHQDFSSGVSRKLSLVLQLSDPSEYEGGNLEIMAGSAPLPVTKQRGLIVAFPSFSLHQVTPVVRGTRQSLVAWASGPAFR